MIFLVGQIFIKIHPHPSEKHKAAAHMQNNYIFINRKAGCRSVITIEAGLFHPLKCHIIHLLPGCIIRRRLEFVNAANKILMFLRFSPTFLTLPCYLLYAKFTDCIQRICILCSRILA